MSDCAAQAPKKDGSAPLGDALARWSADQNLAALAASPGAILLVLDEEGERILYASESGAVLRSAIADAEGLLRGSIGLAAQIRRIGALSERPRLARLRFDGRGIAPPTTCRVARAPLGNGSNAVLLALAGPPPAMRVPAHRPQAAGPEHEAPARRQDVLPEPLPEAKRAVSNRLVWRSDSEGRLTQVSGGRADVAAMLLGKSWDDLSSDSSGNSGDGLRSALRERRTFRSVAVTLRPADGGGVELEASGAPSGHAGGVFAGFSGFAIIKPRRLTEAVETAEPVSVPDRPSRSAEAGEAQASALPELTRSDDSVADAPAEAARFATSWGRPSTFESPLAAAEGTFSGQGLFGRKAAIDQGATNRSMPELGAAANAPPSPAAQSQQDLSIDEHAAFREIARALGARFAEDEADLAPVADDGPHGTIPALPAAAADRAGIGEAVSAVLERLPASVLVHRSGLVLFANRRLLDLTGFADLPAIRGANGLDRLLDEPEDFDRQGEPVSFASASGDAIRLHVERSALDWEGEPAELLLAREAPELGQDRLVETRSGDAQAALDQLEDGVVTLDAAGHVLTLNTKAAAILADDAHEVVGKRFVTLFGPDGTAAIDAGLRQAREAGTSEPQEIDGRPGRADSVPLRVRIARLLAVDESPFYATLQDLAPTRQAEHETAASVQSAEEAGRRKLAFFAKAGQAIRAPLNGMLSVADAMLDEQFGPLGSERYRDYLHDIRASGGEALGLLDDLVDLARVEAGRLDLSFADLRLNDLVSGCIAEMQPEAARERIVVRTSLSPDLGALVADERSMRQAALNAIAQAIRHSEAGGQVIVSTTLAERGEIALRVRDTGAGMSPDEIEHALEPFRQAHLPGSARQGGIGLGLTLTKALVEANRGRFRITSQRDEGTLVEMVFPAAQAMSA